MANDLQYNRRRTAALIGETISHYRITAKLGSGGAGEVYEVEDTELRRKVALKILPEELAADPERLERFKREARAVAALDHPNIVTLHSVEEAEGNHFLTMELLEGQVLANSNDPRMHSELGQAYALVGRREEAIREGERALKLQPVAMDAMEGPARLLELSRIHTAVRYVEERRGNAALQRRDRRLGMIRA